MADCASPDLRAFYRGRREKQPVCFEERAQSWVVYRHEDVKTALTSWQGFSSDFQRHLPLSPLGGLMPDMILGLDPPRQTKLRNLISRAFTVRSVEELAPRIAEGTRALIDAFKGRGECELNSQFADVLPVLALADFLGVPAERHAYFRDLGRRYVSAFEAVINRQPVDPRPRQELDAYFTGLLEEKRRDPREDLISRLVSAEVDGERLSQEELLGFCKLLLVAGIGTVARTISLAVWTLLEHPEELARLRADMGLLPSAIEEVLRFRPPLNLWFRATAKDVELRGKTIPAGQMVLLALGSANADEACFAEPDRFDITRSPNPHLGLGAGIHFCLGAPLARLEAKIALTALLTELPDLALANKGPLEIWPGIQANGVVSLPLRFRARY